MPHVDDRQARLTEGGEHRLAIGINVLVPALPLDRLIERKLHIDDDESGMLQVGDRHDRFSPGQPAMPTRLL
jgi:hypothetical protein